MRLPRRDLIATALVAGASVLYLLWAIGAMSDARATGAVVLVLGFAASASAVVPNFDQLLRGNKVYLAVTSLIGLVALIGGGVMLLDASGTGLTVVMAAMGALWLIATIHHGLLARPATASPRNAPQVPRQRPRVAGIS